MQLTNGLTTERFQRIECSLQWERISRYMPAAQKDKELALRYYLWNCDLSEAFYKSLHFSEIVCRNALQRTLVLRWGESWYKDAVFCRELDARFAKELSEAVVSETKQHNGKLTSHHIVSALNFGFWEHLTTKRFERLLWAKGIHHTFPYAPANRTYRDLHDLIESVRRWRNRIAHHRAIFDKGPSRKHQDTLELIKWVCGDTAGWVSSMSKVQQSIAARPN